MFSEINEYKRQKKIFYHLTMIFFISISQICETNSHIGKLRCDHDFLLLLYCSMDIYNKITKSLVCLSDGDTDFSYIVAGNLQGDTLLPYIYL